MAGANDGQFIHRNRAAGVEIALNFAARDFREPTTDVSNIAMFRKIASLYR